jgi:hypothetical protein
MLKNDTFDLFHDSYIIRVDVDHLTHFVCLHLRTPDNIVSILEFSGATRFLFTEMLMQNIVYSVAELEPQSMEYMEAVARFDKTYWKNEKSGMRIAFLSASLGAEMLIEYENVTQRTSAQPVA